MKEKRNSSIVAIIIGLVIVVVCVVGGYFLLNNSNSSSNNLETTTAAKEKLTVNEERNYYLEDGVIYKNDEPTLLNGYKKLYLADGYSQSAIVVLFGQKEDGTVYYIDDSFNEEETLNPYEVTSLKNATNIYTKDMGEYTALFATIDGVDKEMKTTEDTSLAKVYSEVE